MWEPLVSQKFGLLSVPTPQSRRRTRESRVSSLAPTLYRSCCPLINRHSSLCFSISRYLYTLYDTWLAYLCFMKLYCPRWINSYERAIFHRELRRLSKSSKYITDYMCFSLCIQTFMAYCFLSFVRGIIYIRRLAKWFNEYLEIFQLIKKWYNNHLRGRPARRRRLNNLCWRACNRKSLLVERQTFLVRIRGFL